jgi:nucleoid DNA-binding protein
METISKDKLLKLLVQKLENTTLGKNKISDVFSIFCEEFEQELLEKKEIAILNFTRISIIEPKKSNRNIFGRVLASSTKLRLKVKTSTTFCVNLRRFINAQKMIEEQKKELIND